MRKFKPTTWLFIFALVLGTIYGGIYFANRPEANVAVCNSGLPRIEAEFVSRESVEENSSVAGLIKLKTIANQDGKVDLEAAGGDVFGPSSMMINQDKEVFWYIMPNTDMVEVKATISNSCGTSFTQKIQPLAF